jgi:hypothetical protein
MKRAGGRRQAAVWAVTCLALLAICMGVWQLERVRQGVSIGSQRLGMTPVTVFRPVQTSSPAPVVLIAHGFAGSQQLKQPFALTLARNGYVACISCSRSPRNSGREVS